MHSMIYKEKFIFASPEKIATDGYFEFCLKNRKDDIKLMVIDEVHCVSQWGISFRPFYKRIPDFMDKLFGEDSWCRILALTATLNPLELNDICDSFKITTDNILKQSMLIRYKYEEVLEYEPGKIINPDFTIMLSNGKKVYWEHVGMLGNEKYDSDWSHKMEIYEKYYPGLLYRTYETGALSRDAEMIIEKIKQLD